MEPQAAANKFFRDGPDVRVAVIKIKD